MPAKRNANNVLIDLTCVECRKKELRTWLESHGGDCFEDQTHLDSDTSERIYWHYGYFVALRDVLSLLQSDEADLIH